MGVRPKTPDPKTLNEAKKLLLVSLKEKNSLKTNAKQLLKRSDKKFSGSVAAQFGHLTDSLVASILRLNYYQCN